MTAQNNENDGGELASKKLKSSEIPSSNEDKLLNLIVEIIIEIIMEDEE
jgi:hypothetical protein